MQKPLLIACMLDETEPRQEFQRWPLHVTIVPWFKDVQYRKLKEQLALLTERTKPITVTVGEFALLGANTPTFLLKPNRRLEQLHCLAIKEVFNTGGVQDSYRETGYRFNPHISVRYGEKLGDEYTLSQLVLVSDQGNMQRRVEKVFEFDGI